MEWAVQVRRPSNVSLVSFMVHPSYLNVPGPKEGQRRKESVSARNISKVFKEVMGLCSVALTGHRECKGGGGGRHKHHLVRGG